MVMVWVTTPPATVESEPEMLAMAGLVGGTSAGSWVCLVSQIKPVHLGCQV